MMANEKSNWLRFAFVILILAILPATGFAVQCDAKPAFSTASIGTCTGTYNECPYRYASNSLPGKCDPPVTCTPDGCIGVMWRCDSTIIICPSYCVPVPGSSTLFDCTSWSSISTGAPCTPGSIMPTVGSYTPPNNCNNFDGMQRTCRGLVGCRWKCDPLMNIGMPCNDDTDCCSDYGISQTVLRCYAHKCQKKWPQDQPPKPGIKKDDVSRDKAGCTSNCDKNVLYPNDGQGRELCYAAVWNVENADKPPIVFDPQATSPPPYDCKGCQYPTAAKLKIIRFEKVTLDLTPLPTTIGTAPIPKIVQVCTLDPIGYSAAYGKPIAAAPGTSALSNKDYTNEISSEYSEPVSLGTPSGITQAINVDSIYFIYALLAAAFLLGMAYMATHIFNLPHIRPIVVDELGQLVATGIIAFCLVGTVNITDGYVADMLAGTSYKTPVGILAPPTMMAAAQNTLDSLASSASGLIDQFSATSTALGQEASKGIMCNFLGVGFSLVNCSPLNAFRGSITMSAFATTTALADTYAQKFILSLAANYAFSFLIPLGLFLRCFKLTRGAGSALIALGFGFYTVYPTVVVATDSLLHPYKPIGATPGTIVTLPAVGTCDPSETDVQKSKDDFDSYSDKLTDFSNSFSLAYLVIVKILFMSILNLIITLGFIRMFAHFLGSEIDVSALARIS